MGEAALQEAITGAFPAPPDFRLAQVFELVETVNDFDAKVAAGEKKVVAWRHDIDRQFDKVRGIFVSAAVGLPRASIHAILEEKIAPLLNSLQDLIAELEVKSLLREPRIQEVLRRVRGNQQASVALNQRVVRADRVRQSYIDAYIYYYYELIALLASYDPDAKADGETIETPQQLDAFFARLAG